MAIYEGIDYRVYQVEFPNYASEAMVVSNGDGSYSIYLNTRFSAELLRRRLEHELEHIRQDHLYQTERPVAEREAEAEGRARSSTPIPGPEEWEPFVPLPGQDLFQSWRRAMAWAREMQAKGLSPN